MVSSSLESRPVGWPGRDGRTHGTEPAARGFESLLETREPIPVDPR